MDYSLQALRIGPLQVNTYILTYQDKALVIDPGGEAERILAALDDARAGLTHILLTHAHYDHIGAVNRLKKETGATVYIHALDAPALSDPVWNLSDQFRPHLVYADADVLLSDGDRIGFGDGLTVIHTPGHTVGGCCFDTGNWLFSGDTLLDYSIGRTDFPGGSTTELIHSIKEKLFPLSERIIYPGHGDPTRLSDEKRYNQFVGENAPF